MFVNVSRIIFRIDLYIFFFMSLFLQIFLFSSDFSCSEIEFFIILFKV